VGADPVCAAVDDSGLKRAEAKTKPTPRISTATAIATLVSDQNWSGKSWTSFSDFESNV